MLMPPRLVVSFDRAPDVRAQARELRQLLGLHLVARLRQRHLEHLAHLGRRGRQDDDPVAQVDRLVDVVGDEDDRDVVLAPHGQHEVLEVGAGLRVHARERLVHQQDARLVGERAGDRDALLHPARRAATDSGPWPPRAPPTRAPPRRAAVPRPWRSASAAAGRRRSGARSSTGTASGCTPGRRAPSCRAARAPASPSSSTTPAVGSSSPATHLSSVVLPQPDGPDDADELAGRDVERQVADRVDVAVVLLEVLDVQHPVPLSSARSRARRGASAGRAARRG